ncbi:hypothetical protein NW754_016297, partial [Fusarium falciforme]
YAFVATDNAQVKTVGGVSVAVAAFEVTSDGCASVYGRAAHPRNITYFAHQA